VVIPVVWSVQNLRGKARHYLDIDPPTPVLHRLVLGTVGRPLYEYTSELDLLTGFRAALQGESLLIISCDPSLITFQLISPSVIQTYFTGRDISPGNVMLTEARSALLRGFITTLEFARIESLTLSKPGRTLMPVSQSMSVRRTNMDDQGHAF
jgi:hypothetical protein